MKCHACGSDVTDGARFCSSCGTKLGHDDDSEGHAERRQLTLLFSDLVGSTALSEQLDPEDLREVMNDYQKVCTNVIRQYNGFVAKFLGDGVLAYFGFPNAHEDDARQAVRAGLGIVEAVSKLADRYRDRFAITTDVRVGIHTGLAVVGDVEYGAHQERHAITGSTPNIAARIQGEAAPNTVLISADTNHLIGGFFEKVDLGLHELRGIARPVHLFRVDNERTAISRLEAMSHGFTPFAGRSRETQALNAQWERSVNGKGAVAIVGGDPGVGKSRMVHALKERVAEEDAAWLTELRCSPFHLHTSLYPVTEFFERVVFRFSREDTPDVRLQKVVGWAQQYGLQEEMAVPLVCSLLSIPMGEAYSPLNLTPQKQKERTFDMLINVIERRSATQPVLFVIEDVHWADASTLELLDRFIQRVKDLPVMTLITHRPQYEPTMKEDDRVAIYRLTGLDREAAESIIQSTAGGLTLPSEVVSHIVDRTDGIPLFLEEMTKAMIESGALQATSGAYVLTDKLDAIPVPSTLQGSLTARLDRMKDAKPVAQLAATIGREFSFRLLESVAVREVPDLELSLQRLVDAGLLFRKQIGDDVRYVFKHALIQDTAYESLLKSSRRSYHKMIADTILESYPELHETQPELLAHHYTQAGENALAVPLWQRAGEMAIARSAMPEAIGHFRKVLHLVAELPEGPEKVGAELTGQTFLGLAIMQSSGYAHPGVGAAFNRARELCRAIGDPPQVFLVLHGLVKYHTVIGEYEYALDLARQLLATAKEVGDVPLQIEAMYSVSAGLTWMGRTEEAIPVAEALMDLYNPAEHGSAAMIYGEDPYLAISGHHLWAKMVQGYADQAQEEIESSYAKARELGHPWTITYLMVCGTISQQIKRDVPATLAYAQEMFDTATEFGFPFWNAAASVLRGWARAHQGDVSGGIEEMTGGVTLWRALGAVLGAPNWILRIAEGHLLAGDLDTALELAREAIDIIEKTREDLYLSDAHRVVGVILAAKGSTAEAESSLRTALRIAEEQRARIWHLGAAMDLVRLQRTQGDAAEAVSILRSSYESMPEGVDIPIMQEAAQLLGS